MPGIQELQAQDVVAGRRAARRDADDAFAARRHIGTKLAGFVSQRPAAGVFVQVDEVVAVLHSHFNRTGGIERLLFDVDGREELLCQPPLGPRAPPAVHQAPHRVADDAAARHGIDFIGVLQARQALAAILEAFARDQEGVVCPRPDHHADIMFAAQDALQRLEMPGDPVVAQTGVKVQALRLGAEPLKDAEAFVEEHRHRQIGGVLEALHGGRVVVGREVEVGGLAGAIGAGGVGAFDELMGQLQVAAVCALIAHRPNHHRGMVPVPLDQFGGQLQAERGQAGVADHVAGPASPALVGPAKWRLVFHIKAKLVGGVEGFRIRRVMGGAHGVEIGAFHELDVPPRAGFADGPTGQRVRVVPAGAPKLHRLAIKREGAPYDLDLFEADALFDVGRVTPGGG